MDYRAKGIDAIEFTELIITLCIMIFVCFKAPYILSLLSALSNHYALLVYCDRVHIPSKWRILADGIVVQLFTLVLALYYHYYNSLDIWMLIKFLIPWLVLTTIIIIMMIAQELTIRILILALMKLIIIYTNICNLISVMMTYSTNAFLLNLGILQDLTMRTLMTVYNIIMGTFMIAHDIVDDNFQQKQQIAKAIEDLWQQLFTWLSRHIIGNQYCCSLKSLLRKLEEQGFWEIVLITAGDVERNPGPPQMSAKELAKISNETLVEDNLVEVIGKLSGLASKWHEILLFLGLPPGVISQIGKDHPSDSRSSLCEGLTQWLNRNYNTDKYGLPTWRRVVEAVDNPAGGNNHKLALDIARQHKSIPVCLQQAHRDNHSDLEKAEQMSSAFNKLYRSIMCHLQVNVSEVRDILRYCSNPRSLSQRCVPPSVYQDASSTKDLLDQLYPEYINPENTFVLREIINNCGSHQCKKLLEEYTSEFHD